MSQNRFYATALASPAYPSLKLDSTAPDQRIPVQVLCGWDRPLQNFFLNVETHVPQFPELEQSVYDNLRHGDGAMTLAQVMATLEHFGISHPAGLREALAAQQQANLPHEEPKWESSLGEVAVVAERTGTVEAWRLPAGLKWTSRNPVPAIGQRVHVHMNSIGAGVVQQYYHDAGYLGVLVKLDVVPEWYCRGQHPKPLPGVFGRELDPYQ